MATPPLAGSDLDFRLPAIRIRDVILAALQATFAQDDLMGEGRLNSYRFVRSDPKGSPLWICSGEARVDGSERDGRRALITVTRGDYTPQELHLHNSASGGGSDNARKFSDLGVCLIIISCEAGNETAAEVLGSMAYHIIKHFRHDLMRDYDVHNLRLLAVSPAQQIGTGKGSPYVCRVTIEVKLQEHAKMIELANRLNHLDVTAHLKANIISAHTLDAPDPALEPVRGDAEEFVLDELPIDAFVPPGPPAPGP